MGIELMKGLTLRKETIRAQRPAKQTLRGSPVMAGVLYLELI